MQGRAPQGLVVPLIIALFRLAGKPGCKAFQTITCSGSRPDSSTPDARAQASILSSNGVPQPGAGRLVPECRHSDWKSPRRLRHSAPLWGLAANGGSQRERDRISTLTSNRRWIFPTFPSTVRLSAPSLPASRCVSHSTTRMRGFRSTSMRVWAQHRSRRRAS